MFDDHHQTFDLGKYSHMFWKACAMLRMCQYEHQTFDTFIERSMCFYQTFDTLIKRLIKNPNSLI
jgi:hypothetical protein